MKWRGTSTSSGYTRAPTDESCRTSETRKRSEAESRHERLGEKQGNTGREKGRKTGKEPPSSERYADEPKVQKLWHSADEDKSTR